MKTILISLFCLLFACSSISSIAQSSAYLFIQGQSNIPFLVSIDGGQYIKSQNNFILFNKMANGKHQVEVSMIANGQNIKDKFTVEINNTQPIGLQLSISPANKILHINTDVDNKQVEKIAQSNKTVKKKSFFDKLLGESADGTDVKDFGLYKAGISDANQDEYALLQKKAVQLAKVETVKPYSTTTVVANVAPKQAVKAKVENITPANPLPNQNPLYETPSKAKKETVLKSIGAFFTEPSRDNNEVKINHPNRNVPKVEKPSKVQVVKEIENVTATNPDAAIIAAKQLAAENAKKIADAADFEKKQAELANMKAEKEKMDAIATAERKLMEKTKFLELQKAKTTLEQKQEAAKAAEEAKIEAQKKAVADAEQRMKDVEEQLKAKKEMAAVAKAKEAELARKIAAEKAEKENAIALAKQKVEDQNYKIEYAKAEKARIEKEAKEAKARMIAEEALAKKKAIEEERIAALKIKEQQEFAKKNELMEKAKIVAAEKEKKIEAEQLKKLAIVAERKLMQEKEEAEALAKAERAAEEQKAKAEIAAAARIAAQAKEIEAKKELVAEQARKEQIQLEKAKIQETAALELAKKETQEWKTKYEAEQKAMLELEIKTKLTAEINEKMEEERKQKESTNAEAIKAAEKAKLTKLEKKVNKVKNRPNTNCQSLYAEEELVSIFQKLEAKMDDESRLGYCKKLLKDKKCFNCKDLEQLAQSYNTQTGKFGFLQMMFPYVQDNENYELLEGVFKYESYKAKVRMEFGGEVEAKQ
jgi:Domain of unknown function (DUF4476)